MMPKMRALASRTRSVSSLKDKLLATQIAIRYPPGR